MQSPINSFRGLIDFACPSNGYISGFVSDFDASQTDRLWQPYCCARPFSSLTNCQTLVGGWENPLRGNLNYTGPSDNHVVAGIQSFYFNRYHFDSKYYQYNHVTFAGECSLIVHLETSESISFITAKKCTCLLGACFLKKSAYFLSVVN